MTIEEIKIPKIYAAKAAVAAVSSVWFGEKSLLIYGGTEPAIREGGRSIFLLRSSYHINILNRLINCNILAALKEYWCQDVNMEMSAQLENLIWLRQGDFN